MSYARFGPESSVYVYLDTDGTLRCDLCDLAPDTPGLFRATTTAAMVDHLDQHTAVGHTVPPGTVPALIEDDHTNFPPAPAPADEAWPPPVIGLPRHGRHRH